MIRHLRRCLPCFVLLAVTLSLAGCGKKGVEKDPATIAYVRQSAAATGPITTVTQEWGYAMLPWFEGKEVDLQHVREVQQVSVQKLHAINENVKAIPVPERKSGATMFNHLIVKYADWEEETMSQLFADIAAMAEQENPASPETIDKARAHIDTLNRTELQKKGELERMARFLGTEI